MESLEKAQQLKKELDGLRPLSAEAEGRILQKFRLDWNYHSNNIEGNTLTYGETKALILFGITAQGKPLKDHFEITGHNEAINWILEIVKDETPLTEKFIRELHALLLKESSYKEALTSDGKLTRRKIEIGKYKTQPNHVITVTGETFYFAAPEETPAKMHELVEWFRAEKEKPDVNPIILAALFHYRFIRIHPFDDGNGRTARIVMNFVLMQFGYPPVIIKTEDKENYYAVLRLADADQIEPFISYIAQNLISSLKIMIRGAKGESIEERNDLDKELALLESRLNNVEDKFKIEKTPDNINRLFDDTITPFFYELVAVSKKFDKFYKENKCIMFFDNNGRQDQNEKDTVSKMRGKLNINIFSIKLVYEHRFFKTGENIHFATSVEFKLDVSKYIVKNSNHKVAYEKSYNNPLTADDIKSLVYFEFKRHKDFIEDRISNLESAELI